MSEITLVIFLYMVIVAIVVAAVLYLERHW
ncbi:small membrane protein YldA [Phytobacter sp. V91]